MSMAIIQPYVETEINQFNLQCLPPVEICKDNRPMDPIIGKAIKDGLRRKGLSQRWLAEKAEVSDNAVSKWIKTGQIAREYAAIVCRELDIPAETMLRMIDEREASLRARARSAPTAANEAISIDGRMDMLEELLLAAARTLGIAVAVIVGGSMEDMRDRVRAAISGEFADEPPPRSERDERGLGRPAPSEFVQASQMSAPEGDVGIPGGVERRHLAGRRRTN